MFRTAVLQSKKRALALSVYFKQPELGMKDYEILSRASAFLLSVDPPRPSQEQSDDGKYSHLDKSIQEREKMLKKQDYAYDPAGGPRRQVQDLGWLEFVPSNFRPIVHCVAASHVLAPWMWKDYYPQDWLSSVRQEHCSYSLEVFDPEKPNSEALAKFALHPYAIHHPEALDLAIIHLKEEETVLRHLEGLGVEVLHLRDDDKNFEEGEAVSFEGFSITDDSPAADMESLDSLQGTSPKDDTRIFMPYTETGNLIMATTERLLAKTEVPLPEGLCGGPTLDDDGRVCGIVEGIVPRDHSDERVAGAASFIPSFRIQQFLDVAEHIMLESIVPADIFHSVVELKTTGVLGTQNMSPEDAADEYKMHVSKLREQYSKPEYDAIIGTVERERAEVIDIMEREGGELDEVIGRVRENTMRTREELLKKYGLTEGEFEDKSGEGGGSSKKDP
jgi:hypothetical protein